MSRFDRATLRLDDWRFWVGVAYFGIAGTVVGLYVLFSQQSNETAQRVAIQRAAAQSEVTNCANGVKNAPVVAGFLAGQRALITNSLVSTRAALRVEPKSDPLRKVRLASKTRLLQARKNLNEFAEIVSSTTPTERSCNRLAARLRLPKPFPHPPKGHP